MSAELFSEAMAGRLRGLAERLAGEYRGNRPFPHIVIDDFLPAAVLEGVVRDYPSPEDLPWIEFDKPEERKLAFNQIERLPGSIREVLHFMNSPPMLSFLERMSGVENLIPDPYYVGGGLHQIRRGGHLGVHVDFNKYKRFGLERRLNMLIYLNKDWPEEFGGHLELWDERMEACVKRVAPLFNRCVVFSTSEISYHGHPEPLACPKDRARRSLATYYYTNGRGDIDAAAAHSTVFRDRPGEHTAARAAKRALAQLVPPIVGTIARKLRRR
jgi:hypothetical protein